MPVTLMLPVVLKSPPTPCVAWRMTPEPPSVLPKMSMLPDPLRMLVPSITTPS